MKTLTAEMDIDAYVATLKEGDTFTFSAKVSKLAVLTSAVRHGLVLLPGPKYKRPMPSDERTYKVEAIVTPITGD